MQLESYQRNVERSGTIESARFQIEANPVAIDILSSKLYTNNILAIVRELACNAWDAHVAAGTTDTPFDVHFPTALKHEFRIRDYGTGLAHEQIMTLYLTFFGSDKRNTNSAIGGLGLGSKTPFAYTTTFAVRSFFNGEVRTYAIYIDADGMPACDLVDTQSTTEHNGLEITVPAKAHDIYKFTNEVHALDWFPTQPNITGCGTVDRPKFTFKGEAGGILDESKTKYSSAKVVMGSVAYNLDARRLSSLDLSMQLKGMASASNFVLFAEIGELAISASREELNYNDKTIARLKEMITTTGQEVRAHYENLWKGEERSVARFYKMRNLPAFVANLVSRRMVIDVPGDIVVRKVDPDTWKRKKPSTTAVDKMEFTHNTHPHVLVLDTKTAPYVKIISENAEFQPKRHHSWSRQVEQDVYILQGDDVSEIVDELDPAYVYYSKDYYKEADRQMPKGGNQQKLSAGARKRQMYLASKLHTGATRYGWKNFNTTLDDFDGENKIFIGFNGFAPYDADGGKFYDEGTCVLANSMRPSDKVFVGVPKSFWKTVKRHALKNGWLLFDDWFPVAMKTFHAKYNRERYVAAMHEGKVRSITELTSYLVGMRNILQKYCPDSKALELANAVQDKLPDANYHAQTELKYYEDKFNNGQPLYTFDDAKDLDWFKAIEADFANRYPGLKTAVDAGGSFNTASYVLAAQYINLKEGSSK